MPPNNVNVPADGISYFTPAQIPPAGTALDPQPDGQPIPKLFKPLKIRGVEFHNRIFLSPLCQFSADGGKLTMWHKAHLGGIFTRGPGLSFVEATAVLPEGRITPQDSGIWSDAHIQPLAEIVEFAHSQGQKIGLQLAHAGRKASTVAPWIKGDETVSEEVGGWPDNVWAPSAVKWKDTYPQPKELTKEGIAKVKVAFAEGAKRALRAGFDVVEIHNAHGYLLDSFISPSRPLTPCEALFQPTCHFSFVFPEMESWTSKDTVRLAPILHDHGVDFLDVSTGGNHPEQKIIGGPVYQAPFAHDVKASLDPGMKLVVGSVGAITNGHTAQEILEKGQADVVSVGRQFQKNPGTVWAFAEDLNTEIKPPNQIGWGSKGRAVKTPNPNKIEPLRP